MPEEPWLKTCHRLPDDPAVIGIAKETTLDQDTVVGKLLRAWIWADQNLVDGHAPGVTGKWLDGYVSCDGFAQAMANVEPDPWLLLLPDGIVFPKFGKHMGSTAKKRALDTARQQRHRAGLSRNKCDKSATRGEESRVEKKKSTCDKPAANKPKAPTSEFRQIVLALEETVGECATRPEHKRRSKTVNELLAAGATPDEVRARAGRYRRGWPEMELTDRALVEHWSKFGPDAKLGRVPLVEQEDDNGD